MNELKFLLGELEVQIMRSKCYETGTEEQIKARNKMIKLKNEIIAKYAVDKK